MCGFGSACAPSPRIFLRGEGWGEGFRFSSPGWTACTIAVKTSHPQTPRHMKDDPRTQWTRSRTRALRRDGSDAEGILWRRLRGRQVAGAKFRRQHPLGIYFADFCCVEAQLVIEIDGGQHTEQARQDAQQTVYLASQGFRVIRFWNHDVLARTDAVLESIRMELEGHAKSD